MFEPRSPKMRRPLKHRSCDWGKSQADFFNFWYRVGWLSAVPAGPFVVPPRTIPRIYTYIKKLIRYPKTRSRFWVNAQCSKLITRKPLNVRMGKGKGAKVRLYTYFRGGSALASISSLRQGLQKKLKRFMSVRLGRPVIILKPSKENIRALWCQGHRTQPKYLRNRAREIKTILGFTRKPTLKFFFSKLFKLAWKRPRLRWRFRWAFSTKRSLRLRGKKTRWGMGTKKATLLWGGLSSLSEDKKKEGTRLPKKYRLKRLWGTTFRGRLKKTKPLNARLSYRIRGNEKLLLKIKKAVEQKEKARKKPKLTLLIFKKKLCKYNKDLLGAATIALLGLIPSALNKWKLTYALVWKNFLNSIKTPSKYGAPFLELRAVDSLEDRYLDIGFDFFLGKKSPKYIKGALRAATLLEQAKIAFLGGLRLIGKEFIVDMLIRPNLGKGESEDKEEGLKGACLRCLTPKGFKAQATPKLRPLVLTSCVLTAF